MEESELGTVPETLNQETLREGVDATMREEEENESLADLMVCDSGARMVAGGFSSSNCAGVFIVFNIDSYFVMVPVNCDLCRN